MRAGHLPAQDTARSVMAMELPPGTQIATTEKTTENIVAMLRKRPEVKSVFVDGGRVPPGIQEVRRAALIIAARIPKDGDFLLTGDFNAAAGESSAYKILAAPLMAAMASWKRPSR